MAEFSAEVRQREPVPVIAVSGDLDGRAGDALDVAYAQAVDPGRGVLVLNFDGLGFMNSTGIALVVGLLARARRDGVDVRVCGLNEHYRHVFEITRLADVVTVFSDEEAAMRTGESVAEEPR